MNTELLTAYTPEEIAKKLTFNPEIAYQRQVERVTWVPKSAQRILFHSAAGEYGEICPHYCQSFDYLLDGTVVPVTYVLPMPHVVRVSPHSDLWEPNRVESYETTKLPYSYLTFAMGKMQGRIRLASTMQDQFLLAAENSGLVYRVDLTERTGDGQKVKLQEYISLLPLPVVESHRFETPSPIGFGMAGYETHLPYDLPRPDFVGNQELMKFLDLMRPCAQKSEVIDLANMLVTIRHPEQLLHGIFQELVEENRVQMKQVFDHTKRLFVCNYGLQREKD